VTTASHCVENPIGVGFLVLERDELARTAIKFTVTSTVGVTEVVDHPESARAALEQVLVLLGRKRKDVHIVDENGRRRTPAELCLLAAREVATLPDDNG
jgi:hypothetical protein